MKQQELHPFHVELDEAMHDMGFDDRTILARDQHHAEMVAAHELMAAATWRVRARGEKARPAIKKVIALPE